MQAGFNASVKWARAREERWRVGDEQASRGVRPLHRGANSAPPARLASRSRMANSLALLPILGALEPSL